METLSDNIIDSNDDWPIRCAYWQSEYQKLIPKRKRRETPKTGLVLTGNGLSINVDKGRLIIKDGFTHYPQKAARFEFFKGALDIPPRIVIVDGKGVITLDALEWLAEQGVPLIRLKWDGSFSSVVTSGGLAADQNLAAWQMETRDDPKRRAKFALELVTAKVEATRETLEGWLPRSKCWERSYENVCAQLERLRSTPPKTLDDILGIEGAVASDYFRAWRGVQMKWKATARYPVPDEWQGFVSRSALRSTKHISNRNATHPINAMLNYVYASLLSKTQIEVIAEGYDSALGIVHDKRKRDRGRVPGFALDRMEPLRPVVDRAVLKLVNEEAFSGADFQLQSDGVTRIVPEMAKRLVIGWKGK